MYTSLVNKELLSAVQIILSVLLMVLVLLQAKGSGLGAAFGGDFGFYHTRRGVERILFRLTIVVAIFFLASSAIGLLV